MTPAARYAAAIDVLDGFLAGEPAEKRLSNWARKNRYAGSKDRAAVRDIVFDCLRNLRSYGKCSGLAGGRGLALGHCLAHEILHDDIFSGQGYAPTPLSEKETAQRVSAPSLSTAEAANIPDWLLPIAQKDLGEAFIQTTQALSQRADVDLRVNLAKTSVQDAITALQNETISTTAIPDVPTALRVTENPRRVASSNAFNSGLIELQDAASQAVVDMLDIKAGNNVLDYCAGGGGKTLAMAGKMPNTRYSAWDVNPSRALPN